MLASIKNKYHLEIVNKDKMFTLISVIKKTEIKNAVSLKLDGNPFLQRDFTGENYRKYELIIYGIKEENEFIKRINEFVGDYIDFEELENKKLDFWSDGYQIGEFKFDTYKEIITPFEKEDWIEKHKFLIKYFYEESDFHRNDSVRWRKFVDNLEFFLKKEIKNSQAKTEFLRDKQKSGNDNKKAIELANKILNLVEQYKIEEGETEANKS